MITVHCTSSVALLLCILSFFTNAREKNQSSNIGLQIWVRDLFSFYCFDSKDLVIRKCYLRMRHIVPFRFLLSFCGCCFSTVAKIVTFNMYKQLMAKWHACIGLFTFRTAKTTLLNLLQFKCSIISNLRSICANKADEGKATKIMWHSAFDLFFFSSLYLALSFVLFCRRCLGCLVKLIIKSQLVMLHWQPYKPSISITFICCS